MFTLSCIVDACDMKLPTRDVIIVFKQEISNKNPSGVPLADIVRMSVDERRKHRGELQHAAQRHKCCKYCVRDGVCRFGFPLPLAEKTHIMIEGNYVEKKLRAIPENQEDDTSNLGPTNSYELYYCIDRRER